MREPDRETSRKGSANAWKAGFRAPPAFVLPAVLLVGTVGPVTVVALPLLADLHRNELRVRAMASYAVGIVSGVAVAALINAVCSGAGLTWRVPLVLSALLAAVAVAVGGWLRDVPVGTHDRRRIRRASPA